MRKDILSLEMQNSILQEYEKIWKNLKKETEKEISMEQAIIYLKLCSETYGRDISPFCVNICNEMLQHCLEKLKKEIESKKTGTVAGMYCGIGLLAHSIKILCDKGCKLEGFNEFCNKLLKQTYTRFCKNARIDSVKISDYDMLYGVSGVLYHLLDNYLLEKDATILELMRYLVKLSSDKNYKGYKLLYYHIERDQQYLRTEKEEQPDGHLNLGLAHGILGPLIALAKAKMLHYEVEGLDNAIHKLLEIYRKFEKEENGVLKYPMQLVIHNGYCPEKSRYSIHSGWCYGNAGTVRGLMKVAFYLGEEQEYQYYKQALLKIIDQDLDDYELQVPFLCHGYASVVEIQISAYKETGDVAFVKNLERNVRKLLEEHCRLLKADDEYAKDWTLLEGQGGVILTLLDAISMDVLLGKLLMID